MKFKLLFSLLCAGAMGCPVSFAYELRTHAEMSYAAFGQSIRTRDASVAAGLGLDLSDTDVFGSRYFDSFGSEYKPREADRYEVKRMRPNVNDLATAVDQFGAIVDGAISEEFAEYVLVRNKGAGKQAYLIYFFRGGDGVWRISQM